MRQTMPRSRTGLHELRPTDLSAFSRTSSISWALLRTTLCQVDHNREPHGVRDLERELTVPAEIWSRGRLQQIGPLPLTKQTSNCALNDSSNFNSQVDLLRKHFASASAPCRLPLSTMSRRSKCEEKKKKIDPFLLSGSNEGMRSMSRTVQFVRAYFMKVL